MVTRVNDGASWSGMDVRHPCRSIVPNQHLLTDPLCKRDPKFRSKLYLYHLQSCAWGCKNHNDCLTPGSVSFFHLKAGFSVCKCMEGCIHLHQGSASCTSHPACHRKVSPGPRPPQTRQLLPFWGQGRFELKKKIPCNVEPVTSCKRFLLILTLHAQSGHSWME